MPSAHGQIEGIGVAPRLRASMADGHVVADESFPVSQVADHDAAFRLVRLVLSIGLRDNPPVAVGHRVVHGGSDFSEAVCIDDDVIARLEALIPLAPLHQPHNLTAIRAVRKAAPDLLQVACFDTAFHAGHDMLAQLMALPYSYYERGIRRYGFHGLSYEYIARRLSQVAPDLAEGRVIVAHLGNGASLCAMRNGRSVDSTMGLTALDGLPMGTRCGAIDPGAVLWLAQQGMTADAIQTMLYGESGLKGLSGVSSDMRVLLASDERARGWRWIFTRTARRRRSASLRSRLAGLMRWCSRPALGPIHLRCARASVRIWNRCLASALMLRPMRRTGSGSAAMAAGYPCLSCLRMKKELWP